VLHGILLCFSAYRLHLSFQHFAASWYSTQLFYSQPFYDATVTSSPDELRSFVDLWLDSYANLTASKASNMTSICQDLPDVDDGNLISICEVVIAYGGDWTEFVEEMLYEASVAFGDAEFVTRSASAEGRIAPLQGTDLIIQTGMTPTGRVVNEGSEDTWPVYRAVLHHAHTSCIYCHLRGLSHERMVDWPSRISTPGLKPERH